jgi:hypothetical protein
MIDDVVKADLFLHSTKARSGFNCRRIIAG